MGKNMSDNYIQQFENLFISRSVFLHNWSNLQEASKRAAEAYGAIVSRIKAIDETTGVEKEVDCVWIINEEAIKTHGWKINENRSDKIEKLNTHELIDLRVSQFNLVLSLSAYLEALKWYFDENAGVTELLKVKQSFDNFMDTEEAKLLIGYRNYSQHYFPVLGSMIFGEKGAILCVNKSDLPFLDSMRKGIANDFFKAHIKAGKSFTIDIVATKLVVKAMELLEEIERAIKEKE